MAFFLFFFNIFLAVLWFFCNFAEIIRLLNNLQEKNFKQLV